MMKTKKGFYKGGMFKRQIGFRLLTLLNIFLLLILFQPAQSKTFLIPQVFDAMGFTVKAANNEAVLLPRVVRVNNTSGNAGQQVTVPLGVDAEGDEASYGFSLNYDVNILSNPVVTIGNAGGNVLANGVTNPGKIGFSVDFGGGTTNQGNGQILVTVRFDINSNATSGQTPLTFGDVPAIRRVSNVNAQSLETTFADGVLTINGSAPTPVTIMGRVLSSQNRGVPRATITLIDSQGASKQALTNPFGYYRIKDVSPGQDVTIRAFSKSYEIRSRVISVNASSGDVNFTATRR